MRVKYHQLPVVLFAFCQSLILCEKANANTVVTAWGSNNYGQIDVPTAATNIVTLACGSWHTLALRTDGTVIAWGDDRYGKTQVPHDLNNVIAISAGEHFSLALRNDGSIVVWGVASNAEMKAPKNLSNVVSIACGWQHCLALKADGTVTAWGYNIFGQTDVPMGLTNVIAIDGGGVHSLALKADGTVVAWGNNDHGQTKIPKGLSNVVAIAAAYHHNLALISDGTVVGWGFNASGQTRIPVDLSGVVSVNTGGPYSLALKADGTVGAWGDNSDGQLNVPGGMNNVIAIAGGGYHCVALTRSSNLDPLVPLGPVTLLQPTSIKVLAGTDTTFGVGIFGLPKPAVQWLKDGMDLEGMTNAMVSFKNIQPWQAGKYWAVIKNFAGVVTSDIVHVDISVILTVNTTEGGTTLVDPIQDSFTPGSLVTITALPQPGFRFIGWQGGVLGTNNPLNITMDQSKILTPVFKRYFTLSIQTNGFGSVFYEPKLSTYLSGELVVLTAIPASNYAFQKWTGDITDLSNPLNLDIQTNRNITAVFVPTHALNIQVDGQGEVSVVPQKDQYAEGENVELTAIPAGGFGFSEWSGAITSVTERVILFIDGAKTVIARFKPLRTLKIQMSGQGKVSCDPNYPAFLNGALVQLTAIANTNWQFTQWTGDATGTQNPISISLDANKEVTANFKQLFTITTSINNLGEVKLTPQKTAYLDGETVRITATSFFGYRFIGWSGDLAGTNNPVSIIADSNKNIIATFSPTWKLQIARKGFETDGFHLNLEGEVGMKYEIEFSSGLIGWTPLVTITNIVGITEVIDSQAKFLNRRFYRSRPLE